MALTKDDITAIKEALKPEFDRLDKKIDGVEKRFDKKLDDVKEELTDTIQSLPEIMHRDFPTRENVQEGLDAFQEAIHLPAAH